jgi:Arc/MetJ-type ribon-helix-helix transcriptional regulator
VLCRSVQLVAKDVNVRFAGELLRFIQTRVGGEGPYPSAREYLQDLVRRDYEREENSKARGYGMS